MQTLAKETQTVSASNVGSMESVLGLNPVSTTRDGIRTEVSKSPIELTRIYVADYQKEGTLTAEIKQSIFTKSTYPSKKVSNDKQENLFDIEDFGFESQVFDSTEVRVAWIPVPSSATMETVSAKVAAAMAKGACIYKVLSSAPILSKDQIYAIGAGIATKDQFANSQAVRYGKEYRDEALRGKLTLDPQGRVQYRKTFFWNTPQADQDLRGKEEVYLSAEIAAEIAGASVLEGQTI